MVTLGSPSLIPTTTTSFGRIGKAMGKSIRLSIVALHSVDGVHQQFKEVVKLADEPGALRKQENHLERLGPWQSWQMESKPEIFEVQIRSQVTSVLNETCLLSLL